MSKLLEGMDNFGATLKRMRKEQGLTQRELAKKVGCSYQLIWKYETNSVENVPLPQIEKVAHALGTTAWDMLGLGDRKVAEQGDKVRSAFINAPDNVQRAVLALLDIK